MSLTEVIIHFYNLLLGSHILLLSRIIDLPFARSTEGISEKQEVFFKKLTPSGAEIGDTCVVNGCHLIHINCLFPVGQHKKKRWYSTEIGMPLLTNLGSSWLLGMPWKYINHFSLCNKTNYSKCIIKTFQLPLFVVHQLFMPKLSQPWSKTVMTLHICILGDFP